jgi:hypothetical protein
MTDEMKLKHEAAVRKTYRALFELLAPRAWAALLGNGTAIVRCADAGTGPELVYLDDLLDFFPYRADDREMTWEVRCIDVAIDPASLSYQTRKAALEKQFPNLRLDASPKRFVVFAEQHAAGEGPPIHVITSTQMLSIPDNGEVSAFFEAAARVLVPGGLLLCVFEPKDRATLPENESLPLHERTVDSIARLATPSGMQLAYVWGVPAHYGQYAPEPGDPFAMAGFVFVKPGHTACHEAEVRLCHKLRGELLVDGRRLPNDATLLAGRQRRPSLNEVLLHLDREGPPRDERDAALAVVHWLLLKLPDHFWTDLLRNPLVSCVHVDPGDGLGSLAALLPYLPSVARGAMPQLKEVEWIVSAVLGRHEAVQEEITRRAYQLFEERGSALGQDMDDWFAAERMLSQEYLTARAADLEARYPLLALGGFSNISACMDQLRDFAKRTTDLAHLLSLVDLEPGQDDRVVGEFFAASHCLLGGGLALAVGTRPFEVYEEAAAVNDLHFCYRLSLQPSAGGLVTGWVFRRGMPTSGVYHPEADDIPMTVNIPSPYRWGLVMERNRGWTVC